jgi:GTPase SAR1 family protein
MNTHAGVGKSCLLLRYSDDTFTTSFVTTIGLEPRLQP